MPIYEYLCEQHGITEVTASTEAIPEFIECPLCEEGAIPRVYSVPNVQFKGTGFYSTDKGRR